MRSLVMALVAFAVTSCVSVSQFKVDGDGQYRFKHEPIVVWAPKECLLDIAVRDTDHSVDFTTGVGYWMAGGLYSAQVFTFDQLAVDDKHPFQERMTAVAARYMVNDRADDFNFVFRDGKALEIAGRPAYQAVAVEEGKATFVATFVLQDSRVTVASLVFPIEKPNSKMGRSFPWDCYNKFVASVKEVH